jgi:hypothetical protein
LLFALLIHKACRASQVQIQQRGGYEELKFMTQFAFYAPRESQNAIGKLQIGDERFNYLLATQPFRYALYALFIHETKTIYGARLCAFQ